MNLFILTYIYIAMNTIQQGYNYFTLYQESFFQYYHGKRYRILRKICLGLYSNFTVFLCLCGYYLEAVYSPVLEQKSGLFSRFTDRAANLIHNT